MNGCRTSGPALAEDLLAVGAQRRVAGEPLEQKRLRVLEAGEERGADEARREPNHRRVEQRPPQDAQVERWRNAPSAAPTGITPRNRPEVRRTRARRAAAVSRANEARGAQDRGGGLDSAVCWSGSELSGSAIL